MKEEELKTIVFSILTAGALAAPNIIDVQEDELQKYFLEETEKIVKKFQKE